MTKQFIAKHVMAISLIALMGLIVVAACTPTQPTSAPTQEAATEAPKTEPAPVETAAPELEGDMVQGGRLYDAWWEGLGLDAPTDDHPLWKTQTTNTRSGADTWRCKECHGWDYKGPEGAYGTGSHFTGFPGVLDSAGKPASGILAALKGGTNPDHDFSKVMAEQDLIDLALFVSGGLIDTDALIDASGKSLGSAADGEDKFGEVCSKCHGPDGNAINFADLAEPEFLGHVAGDNPWEFVHKVRFGQPGWPMPSAIVNEWTQDDVANVLAYAQTVPTEPALSGGGPLYDVWWEALGLDEPTGDQPLWATQTTNTRSGLDTWRCKECHGWDYKGLEGAYGSGSHQTGFTGVLNSASMSSDELLGWLTGKSNPDHDFSSAMDEAALNALVAFLQTETVDTSPYISTEGVVTGDPAHGKDLFEGTCAACHGTDGKKINFGDDAEPEFLGTVAADNPWEFFHKASFGQPGEPMPAGKALGWSLEDIADLLAYAQTLPAK